MLHLYLLLSWYVYRVSIPLIQVFFQFRALQLLHLPPCV